MHTCNNACYRRRHRYRLGVMSVLGPAVRSRIGASSAANPDGPVIQVLRPAYEGGLQHNARAPPPGKKTQSSTHVQEWVLRASFSASRSKPPYFGFPWRLVGYLVLVSYLPTPTYSSSLGMFAEPAIPWDSVPTAELRWISPRGPVRNDGGSNHSELVIRA